MSNIRTTNLRFNPGKHCLNQRVQIAVRFFLWQGEKVQESCRISSFFNAVRGKRWRQDVHADLFSGSLNKEVQRQAWECLQAMDRRQFKSYSQVIALALVDYFGRRTRLEDDPYLETREREERFVAQIVAAVETAMREQMPVFLSGCVAGIDQAAQARWAAAPAPPSSETAAEADVDWNFLGG
jgi:hypothetical protein